MPFSFNPQNSNNPNQGFSFSFNPQQNGGNSNVPAIPPMPAPAKPKSTFSFNPQGNTTPPVIPLETAIGGVQAPELPKTPTPEATVVPPPTPPTLPPEYGAGVQLSGGSSTSQLNNILGQMQSLPGELESKYGIQDKMNAYNEAKNIYDATKEQYRVQAERIRTTPGQTAGQVQADLNELARKEAFQTGTLAIEYAARQGDYQGAQSLMDKQVQLQLEPLKMKYDFYKELYMKTEDQRFAKQMKEADREYEANKAALDAANELKLSAMGVMSPEKANKFVTDTTAKQASSRVGVIGAVQDYIKKLNDYKGPSGTIDFNRLTKAEKTELQTALNTTVGSAINVAQGQGAMGDAEAKRILGSLDPTRWTRTSVFNSAAKGVIDAQTSLLNSNLDLLDVAYPGVRNMPMFSPFMSDTQFFGAVSADGAMIPPTTYFAAVTP